MVSRAYTVAFEGIDARVVEVQCSLSPGIPNFSIVGLPNKSVSEARERVRAALGALSIGLPAKRITINLSPADLPKEGSHYDLPIALSLLGAIGAIDSSELDKILSLGELFLDGRLVAVSGALPAAMAAAERSLDLICPQECGHEAAWVGGTRILAPESLLAIVQHFKGRRPLAAAQTKEITDSAAHNDLQDVKGQERAKRALEIAAAGRHHLLMVGPPGSGKSMLAARMAGLLPDLKPHEALETSMVHSISGLLENQGITRTRPFRAPHHTASMAAIVGGGRGAKPREISLAHNGVLFMDEFPEYARTVLETLRQPIEEGHVTVARANAHVRYPSRFLLIAAANPCRCGHMTDASKACGRAPICGADYLGRISGPLLDRFDLRIEIPPVSFTDLQTARLGEPSAAVRARVAAARALQEKRFTSHSDILQNADAEGKLLDAIAPLNSESKNYLSRAADKFGLSARGYHRVLRVARTIADLAAQEHIYRDHIAEAVSFRLINARG